MAAISQGLDELFRSLQRCELDIASRDQALRQAYEFWRVVREVMAVGPNRELLKKLDEAERNFLNGLDALSMIAEGRNHVERVEQ